MSVPERTRAVRLAEVAERAGVSKKTASAVVNGVGQVRESTRERVLDAIEELGYRPNPAARGLSVGRTGTITLALPNLGTSGAAALASAVFAAGERARVGMLCEPTGGSPEREGEAFRPETADADGVLLVPASAELPLARPVPVVVIGDRAVDAGVDQVVAPIEVMVSTAVAYLAGLGRTRVRVLADPFRAAALGDASVDLIRAGDAGADAGYTAVLGSPEDAADGFDAVVATGETLALGAVHALRDRGLRVPHDVSVVTVGPTTDARFTAPALTSVEPDLEQMSSIALDLLLARLGGEDGPPRRIDVATRLVVRESTSD